VSLAKIDDILAQMRQNPKDVRFIDLCRVCEKFFGEPRKGSGSHRIYKTPWAGDARINIQNFEGRAKAYQVKQVLMALEKLEATHAIKK